MSDILGVQKDLDKIRDETLPAATKDVIEAGNAFLDRVERILDRLDGMIKRKRVNVSLSIYDEVGPQKPE